MIETETLIVGAGPAGAACAGELKKNDRKFILLDKETFPRNKVCAGWITPAVFKALTLDTDDYPYGLKEFREFMVHLKKRDYLLKVHQFAIRRIEFDRFLHEYFELEPVPHQVRKIETDHGDFIIDNAFRAKYLIGAGGSYCPVAKTFFRENKVDQKERTVVAIEEEFLYSARDDRCHLWFQQDDLPGYAWYVPKADGYLNAGIGGYEAGLKKTGRNIKMEWEKFTEKLEKHGLVRGHAWHGKGYTYRVRSKHPMLQNGNVMITGDAAGLATRDMGEGIGPAIESGIAAARSVITGKPLKTRDIRKNSFSHTSVLLQLLLQRIGPGKYHKLQVPDSK